MQVSFFNTIELCKTNEKLRITERLKKTFWVAYIIIESCFYFIFLSDNCSEQQ